MQITCMKTKGSMYNRISILEASVIQSVSHRFTIMIKNLLHFLEYFDDKIISVKNFPLGFEEV